MERNKRQIQKEATRKLILLQSAYEVYSNKGFGAITNMIAKEAQISHGNIFITQISKFEEKYYENL